MQVLMHLVNRIREQGPLRAARSQWRPRWEPDSASWIGILRGRFSGQKNGAGNRDPQAARCRSRLSEPEVHHSRAAILKCAYCVDSYLW